MKIVVDQYTAVARFLPVSRDSAIVFSGLLTESEAIDLDQQGSTSMRLLMTIALIFLLSTYSNSHADFDKDKCAAVKQKIRRIQSKMRSGYTRAQGERLEAQLRKLKKQRRSTCRQ